MRRCEDCQIILDNNVRFCPKCGKQIGPDGSALVSGKRDVGALLASANLHRIRQEWDAAVGDATEALKMEPKNADIASILADIYEQRGMLEDALIWCQMSLEINPDSAAEKARLDRIDKLMRQPATRGGDSFGTFQKRIKIGVLAMAGLFMVIVVLAAIVWGGRDKSAGPSDLDPVQSNLPESRPVINTGPVSPSGSGKAQNSPAMPLVGQSAPIQSGVRTPGEAKIKTDLQSAQKGGLQVDDAIADPRQGILVVTFSVPGGSVTKESVLASAAELARTAFASSPEVKFVTARCVALASDPSLTRIAFVGDIARSSSESLGATPAPDALSHAFTGQWWNPQLR